MANSIFTQPHKSSFDGYTVDLSSGMTTGQILSYNGTSIVPTTRFINTYNFQLPDSSPHTVTTFTPVADGNFIVYIYYRVVTSTTTVTITLTYTDPTGIQTVNVVSSVSTATGSYTVVPIYIQARTTGAITISATSGIANQLFVSGTICAI